MRHAAPGIISLALVAAAVLPLGGCGEGKPGSLVVEPSHIDFGRVPHHDQVDRTLTLRNQGSRPVFISGIKAGCRCFLVGNFRSTLRPGEEQKVHVILASGLAPPEKLRGKRLDITSDDPVWPHLMVPVEGEIFATHSVTPTRVYVDAAIRDRTYRIRVRHSAGFEMEFLSAVASPAELFDVTTEEVEGGTDVILRIRDGAAGNGALKGALAIRTRIEGRDLPQRVFSDLVRIEGDWPP